MSLRDISMFYVLGEDDAHRSFVRAWLEANDVSHRRVHVEPEPIGKSGGIHFVIAKCADVVRAARHRATRAQTRVIVAMDADDFSVEERESLIARTLQTAGESPTELTCLLVPKRHIETWAHALERSSSPPNEHDDYKPKTIQQVREAARRLARLTTAPDGPPSLVRGYEALSRLKS